MPIADTTETVRRWATDRQVELWVAWAADLGPLASKVDRALQSAVSDGARVQVVAGSGMPTPFDVFEAMDGAGVADVRAVGAIAVTVAGLDAAQRAGVGAVLGVVPDGDAERRRSLVAGQPDLIVDVSEIGRVDAERYGSARAHRERLLLNPGPSIVTDRIHRAVGGPDLCHREPEYPALFGRVRAKLLRVAGVPDDWAAVLLGGSGTAAMEAMAGALVRDGRALLVCRNGVYGERLATIAARLRIRVVDVIAPDTLPIDPEVVGRALDANPDVDAVAVVHHETTTGLLNPVPEIAAVARARDVPVVVDAISAFGSEELRLGDEGIDIVASTSNKNLHGLPGVAILLVSPRGQARAREVQPRSLYFDLPNYLDAQARRTVPFTPPIPATYGLEAALDELLDEGPAYRREHYRRRIAALDEGLARLGLVPVVAAEHRSNSVRSIPLPPGVRYDELHDALRQEGYVIYAGLGQAAKSSFRVCVLGAVEIDALHGFLDALRRTLSEVTSPSAAVAAS